MRVVSVQKSEPIQKTVGPSSTPASSTPAASSTLATSPLLSSTPATSPLLSSTPARLHRPELDEVGQPVQTKTGSRQWPGEVKFSWPDGRSRGTIIRSRQETLCNVTWLSPFQYHDSMSFSLHRYFFSHYFLSNPHYLSTWTTLRDKYKNKFVSSLKNNHFCHNF